MGNPKKKANKWEAAFYNIALRLTGKRIPLFNGADDLKKRGAYKGTGFRVYRDKRED